MILSEILLGLQVLIGVALAMVGGHRVGYAASDSIDGGERKSTGFSYLLSGFVMFGIGLALVISVGITADVVFPISYSR